MKKPGERRRRRGGQVQHRDEEQAPRTRSSAPPDRLDRVETHDHMRQTRRAAHQRERDEEDIDLVPRAVRTVRYSWRSPGRRESGSAFEQVDALSPPSPESVLPSAELRARDARQLDADGNRRNQESGDQHPVLRDLRPGDAFHATERGIDEHDRHADDDADRDVDLEESAEHDADATHLSGDVGETDEERAKHGDERARSNRIDRRRSRARCSGRTCAGTARAARRAARSRRSSPSGRRRRHNP